MSYYPGLHKTLKKVCKHYFKFSQRYSNQKPLDIVDYDKFHADAVYAIRKNKKYKPQNKWRSGQW